MKPPIATRRSFLKAVAPAAVFSSLAHQSISARASDAASRRDVPVYATAVGMSAVKLPAGVAAFETRGYNAVDDGGGWLYAVRNSEPPHFGKVAVGDGKWGELVVPRGEITCEALGLIGDNSTDNGARWPSANAYCQANGIRLIARKGTYRTSVKALIVGDTFIRGAGMYASTFKAIGGIDAVFHANTSTNIVVQWEDFQIDGSGTAKNGALFDAGGELAVIIQGSYFRNIRGLNPVIASINSTMPMYAGVMQSVILKGGKHGIYWRANAGMNGSTLSNIRVSQTAVTGVHIENAGVSLSELTMDSPTFEGNDAAGLYINKVRLKMLGASHFEQNGRIKPRAATALQTHPFTTTRGSGVIAVSHRAHGLATGDEINIRGAISVGGIDPNGKSVITKVDTNSYTIIRGMQLATSSTKGGGSKVVAEYGLPIDILIDSSNNILTELDIDKISKSTDGRGQRKGVFARLMASNCNIIIRGGNPSRRNLIDGNGQSSGCAITLLNCFAGTINAAALAVRRDEPGIKKTGRLALESTATATGVPANGNGWLRVTATKRSLDAVTVAMYVIVLDRAGNNIHWGWIGPTLPSPGFEDFVTFSVVDGQVMAARSGGTGDGWMTLEGEWSEF